jgi:hypothetical protein
VKLFSSDNGGFGGGITGYVTENKGTRSARERALDIKIMQNIKSKIILNTYL